MSTPRGARIARYTIEAVAGRGGMGVVYRARDAELDRVIALKVIAPDLARDEGFRARFVREARVTAQLDHPNVIPLYDAGEDDGRLYIAMRWVEGTDLGRLLAEGGPLEPALATELVAQAASALDAAHARGLVHRDVKPANLLLPAAARSHVYLTDFGLAKRDGSSTALTTTGHWLGTPDFAAPEQIEGHDLDARADVYALGCVLFAALTGRAPFADVPRLRKGWAHVNDNPPPLRSIEPGVPAALEDVVARALAKDPAERYGSAGELGEAASAAVLAGRSRRSRETRRLRGTADRGPRTAGSVATARLSRTRRRAGLALAAVLALAGIGVGVAAALGAFSEDVQTPRASPAVRGPRSAVPNGTIRCTATKCTQNDRRVAPPIQDGRCGSGPAAGSWKRLDDGDAPLIACVPSEEVAPADRTAPLPMPDLAGARLDRAERYLDRLGVEHGTSGGGTFGIVVRSNWQVCATAPEAGDELTPDDETKLFVDKSC